MALDNELQAIRDEMDKEVGNGRDQAKAVELADAYVEAHPDLFSALADMSIGDLVNAVDVFRSAKMEQDQWRIETYLLHKFKPQKIGGAVEAEVRFPGSA